MYKSTLLILTTLLIAFSLGGCGKKTLSLDPPPNAPENDFYPRTFPKAEPIPGQGPQRGSEETVSEEKTNNPASDDPFDTVEGPSNMEEDNLVFTPDP